jgi:hypothetical protein
MPDKIIFVSCDLLEADTEHSMWDRMYDELDGNKQIGIIHLGDQAYMDNVFNESVKLVRKYGCNESTKQGIIKSFGKRYYDTWEKHSKILSLTTNYTIWDDHEIRNNINLDEELPYDKDFVRNIGVDAYIKYQQSLHLKFHQVLSDYSWIKRIDSTVIIAIERTSKIIPVEDVISLIKHENINKFINRLILCFSSAPIPRPQGKYGNLYNKFTGDDGTSDKSKFWQLKDLKTLYEELFNWIDKLDGREVLITGGDLHFGTYGTATRNGKSIPVLISSPITNEPTFDRWLASKGLKGIHNISSDISFTTISSKARRCYGIVDLESYPMIVDIKYSSEKYPRSMIKYYKTILSFI